MNETPTAHEKEQAERQAREASEQAQAQLSAEDVSELERLAIRNW